MTPLLAPLFDYELDPKERTKEVTALRENLPRSVTMNWLRYIPFGEGVAMSSAFAQTFEKGDWVWRYPSRDNQK